jgi:hypothetical protein
LHTIPRVIHSDGISVKKIIWIDRYTRINYDSSTTKAETDEYSHEEEGHKGNENDRVTYKITDRLLDCGSEYTPTNQKMHE